MILSNTEVVPGKQITAFFGLVSGSTVRAKHIGKDILAGFKNIVGGELKADRENVGSGKRGRLGGRAISRKKKRPRSHTIDSDSLEQQDH